MVKNEFVYRHFLKDRKSVSEQRETLKDWGTKHEHFVTDISMFELT